MKTKFRVGEDLSGPNNVARCQVVDILNTEPAPSYEVFFYNDSKFAIMPAGILETFYDRAE